LNLNHWGRNDIFGDLIEIGEVGPGVPLANIWAMYEAFREYGRYA